MTTDPAVEWLQKQLWNWDFGCTLHEAERLLEILRRNWVRKSDILPDGMTVGDLCGATAICKGWKANEDFTSLDEGGKIMMDNAERLLAHLLALLEPGGGGLNVLVSTTKE